MMTCTELRERVKTLEGKAMKRFAKHTAYAYKMGDIKNMYTELSHPVIMKALQWTIKTFKANSRLRNPRLTATKYGRRGMCAGRIPLSDEIQLTV